MEIFIKKFLDDFDLTLNRSRSSIFSSYVPLHCTNFWKIFVYDKLQRRY